MAVPGAASVVVDDKLILYVLAIAGAVLAVAWWVLNSLYTAARDAAQSARRATLLVGGLGRPLSAHALLALKEKLTVTEEKARKNENPNYYATRNPAGPGRLAEMIEESAFYSGKLQTISANVMLGVILLFAVIFACIAVFSAPIVARDTAMTGLRVFLAILVFVMSSDVLGAYRLHKSAAKAINEVRMRLVTAEGQGYPEADVLLAMVDYNAAVESAPESVPYAYKLSEKKLNKLWAEYKVDREYTDWIIERNGYTGGNSFRKATRLIKYLRDIKTTFTCSSVLLTTILGQRISAFDQHGSEFADTPTALKTLFSRMDDWAQANSSKPVVSNPFLNTENFADNWTDDQYANFRDVINRYRGWIDDAYAETSRNASIAKWRRVFGEDFASDVVIETAKSVSSTALVHIRETAVAAVQFAGDLVMAVKQFGSRALPPEFNRMPHMKQPRWKAASNSVAVQVRAELYRSRGFNRVGPIQSLDPVGAGNWIQFTAVTSMGLPFPANEFRVKWRITNTDQAAYSARALRGDFYDSDTASIRWEQLQYLGVHLAEAFVIRKRDKALVGQSAPFRVVIDA